jgi:hypothetical protein
MIVDYDSANGHDDAHKRSDTGSWEVMSGGRRVHFNLEEYYSLVVSLGKLRDHGAIGFCSNPSCVFDIGKK